jgi:hypothetical protein
MKSIGSASGGNLQDSKGITFLIKPKPKVARWVFAAVVALGLLSSSCSENTEKLTSLDGKSYRGEAASKRIMGALMSGYYVAKFERDASGNLKCKLSLHLHDSTEGWGKPSTETVQVSWEDRNPEYACIAKGSDLFNELGVAPDKITKESAPQELSLTDTDFNEITLRRQ